jgi:hypothetical protein
MAGDPLAHIRSALNESELLRDTASVRYDGGLKLALGDCELRALHAEEIARLETQGNWSDDWSKVRVASGFDWRRVRESEFHGDVVLGRFDWRCAVDDQAPLMPSGVYRSTLFNCVVGHDALVRDVRLLSNCILAPGAVVFDCGTLTCDSTATYGTGAALPFGIETGGRDVAIFAEIDVVTATVIARSRGCRPLQEEYAKLVGEYTTRAVCGRSLLGPGAVLRNTPQAHNVYLGAFSRVVGATEVKNAALLSDQDERTTIESGASVSDTVLQWGARVSTLAVVQRSVLGEQSHAERHAKVTDSLLGPNTGVGEGEVTACLLGPFVSFHHQALLIATLWPEGKGNVSHGVNAGSNHTGKAPDQEFWPGEGTFLGLGTSVKFPVNLSRSPYSLIACGVRLLPQRIEFPFALVNVPTSPVAGVPEGTNEIAPAWLLTDSLYTVYRNQTKYCTRNRARRAELELDVFRPDTVDLMCDALRRLEAVRSIQDVYTERDIPGLGKNFLTETRRQAACAGYRFFIRLYALLGLKEAAEALLSQGLPGATARLLATPSGNPRWEHQRRLLPHGPDLTDVLAALAELPAMLRKIGRAVEQSKEKDDVRGSRIIDDYAEAHVAAAQEGMVRRTYAEMGRLEEEVEVLLHELECAGAACEAEPRQLLGAAS